jgi:hypothetical protein
VVERVVLDRELQVAKSCAARVAVKTTAEASLLAAFFPLEQSQEANSIAFPLETTHLPASQLPSTARDLLDSCPNTLNTAAAADPPRKPKQAGFLCGGLVDPAFLVRFKGLIALFCALVHFVCSGQLSASCVHKAARDSC